MELTIGVGDEQHAVRPGEHRQLAARCRQRNVPALGASGQIDGRQTPLAPGVDHAGDDDDVDKGARRAAGPAHGAIGEVERDKLPARPPVDDHSVAFAGQPGNGYLGVSPSFLAGHGVEGEHGAALRWDEHEIPGGEDATDHAGGEQGRPAHLGSGLTIDRGQHWRNGVGGVIDRVAGHVDHHVVDDGWFHLRRAIHRPPFLAAGGIDRDETMGQIRDHEDRVISDHRLHIDALSEQGGAADLGHAGWRRARVIVGATRVDAGHWNRRHGDGARRCPRSVGLWCLRGQCQ